MTLVKASIGFHINCADGSRDIPLPAVDDVHHPDPHNDSTIAHTSLTELVAENI
jgi:hypothetical protein